MNLTLLIVSLSLAVLIIDPARALETPAAATPAVELKTVVARVQAKVKSGQKSAAELAPEIATFDALLEKYQSLKTDEVAQIAYMKATLYEKILNDAETAKKLLAKIATDFPGTRTALIVRGPQAAAADDGKPVDSTKLSSGQVWMTDWTAAKALAAKEGKKLLIDFTGSDWCGYCIKLDKEVFATDEFATFAKNYVLVKLDFPRRTSQSPEKMEQNKALKQEFSVRGFPTVVVADATGKELARTVGYSPGSGTESFCEKISVVTPQ